jgi:diguanylate cyclase (GGDEF)-like protein
MNPSTKRRILLIDDQAAIHDDYRKIICASSSASKDLDRAEAELFGAAPARQDASAIYDIDSAYSGEEAIGLVQRAVLEGRPYAVAFVDIRMPPGIDGVKTMRRIWEIDPEILAVMCSAYSDYTWEEIVKQWGQTERFLILRKPFDTIEVRQCAAALSGRWAVARIDPLTGLLNRRPFGDYVRRQYDLAVRNDQPLGCVMIDVDDFASIHQHHGLSLAEQVVKVVASIVAGQVRPGYVLCRYGGAQFCVLLPGADQTAAVKWAESVRQAIASQPLHLAGQKLHVTASFGITDRKSAWQDELVERAEKAVRHAQAPGRNRVVVWEPATGKEPAESELSRLAEVFGHAAPACDDVQRALRHAGLFRHLAARDVMTAPVTCIPRDMPAKDAAELMGSRKILCVPVINADGTLAGTVAEPDLIEKLGASENWRANVERFMTEGVIQYAPDTAANVIFDFLCRVQIPRVIVVDQQRPVGIVDRAAFLRWAENNAKALSPPTAGEVADNAQRTAVGQLANDADAVADELLGQLVSGLVSIQDIISDLRGWSSAPAVDASCKNHGQSAAAAATR